MVCLLQSAPPNRRPPAFLRSGADIRPPPHAGIALAVARGFRNAREATDVHARLGTAPCVALNWGWSACFSPLLLIDDHRPSCGRKRTYGRPDHQTAIRGTMLLPLASSGTAMGRGGVRVGAVEAYGCAFCTAMGPLARMSASPRRRFVCVIRRHGFWGPCARPRIQVRTRRSSVTQFARRHDAPNSPASEHHDLITNKKFTFTNNDARRCLQ